MGITRIRRIGFA